LIPIFTFVMGGVYGGRDVAIRSSAR